MESQWWPPASALRHAAEHWVTISAASTFVLYLFGYLSLRFKLTALGVGTDLNFLDERYLFEGVRFLVYIVSIIPDLLLVALILAAPAWLTFRLTPLAWRERAARAARAWEIWRLLKQPFRLAMTGIVISLIVIQVLLRKVLPFSNLLVADRLIAEDWLVCMLVGGPGGRTWLYFHALVAVTILTGTLLMLARALAVADSGPRVLLGVLGFLLAMQILLLPINHGVLVSAAQEMPRVRAIGDHSALAASATAWLVWEGRDGITYFVDEGATRPDGRALITLPKNEATMIEIVGYDSPVRNRFGPSAGCITSSPAPASLTEAAR